MIEMISKFHRQLIDDVVAGRENAKLAQQKLQQYKADFVKQYKEDTKQMMKQALEEVKKIVAETSIDSIRFFSFLGRSRNATTC